MQRNLGGGLRSSKFRKILSATLSFGLMSLFFGTFTIPVARANNPTYGSAKISKVTQNGTAHTSASEIANLPWAATGTDSLSISFLVANDYPVANNVQIVCIQALTPGFTDDTRVVSPKGISYGSQSGVWAAHRWSPSVSDGGATTDTVCMGSLAITPGSSQEITFQDIRINNTLSTDLSFTWLVTMITTDENSIAGSGILAQNAGQFAQYEPAVATGGTLTQTSKAPVLTSVTPTSVYANDSAAVVYKITNPTVYIATTGMIGFKYDNIATDPNFNFASTATNLTLHSGDGSADSGWAIASSGPSAAGTNRYAFFHKASGTIAAGAAVNFTVNLKIANLIYNQSKLSWSYFPTSASAEADITNGTTTGWSADVPWYQRGLEITGISPVQVTQNVETPVVVTLIRHYTGDINIQVHLTGTCGTIGTSSPESATLIAANSSTTFSFPYTDAAIETCTLSAVADGNNTGDWIANASNNFSLDVGSVVAGVAPGGTDTGGTTTGSGATTASGSTPQSGPSRYSFLSQLSTGQEIEYSIILLAFLTLICAGAYQHGPAISAKFKQFVSKR